MKCLAAAAVLFVLLSASVGYGLWRDFDVWSMAFLQKLDSHVLVCTLAFFSWIGSAEAALFFGGMICLWLARQGRWREAFSIIFALGAATAVELAGKTWLPQMPIPDEVKRHCHHAAGLRRLSVETAYPYPSGHTLRTVFLSLIAAHFIRERAWPRWILGLLGAASALMMFALVHAGHHWSSDVLGGLLLAWWAFLWFKYRNRAPAGSV